MDIDWFFRSGTLYFLALGLFFVSMFIQGWAIMRFSALARRVAFESECVASPIVIGLILIILIAGELAEFPVSIETWFLGAYFAALLSGLLSGMLVALMQNRRSHCFSC